MTNLVLLLTKLLLWGFLHAHVASQSVLMNREWFILGIVIFFLMGGYVVQQAALRGTQSGMSLLV